MRIDLCIKFAIIGFVSIVFFGFIKQSIDFNNQMISLREMKKVEIETTKVEYGQCVVKVFETNQIAKSYRNDVMHLADIAGNNLSKFNKNLLTLISTQVVPKMSPNLRETVQREIISCRNAYTGRVDLSLKPMYMEFNRLQKQFPNSLYNSLFFHWQEDEFIMPKNSAGKEIFTTGEVKQLDLKE